MEVVREMLRRGACPYTPDDSNGTPYHMAIERGDVAAVEVRGTQQNVGGCDINVRLCPRCKAPAAICHMASSGDGGWGP